MFSVALFVVLESAELTWAQPKSEPTKTQTRDAATKILMDSLVEQGAQTKDGTTIWKALCAMNKDNAAFARWRSQCGTTLPPEPRPCIQEFIKCEVKDIPNSDCSGRLVRCQASPVPTSKSPR